MELEHTPRAADAKHLTEALRRSGVLGKGQVRDAVVESSRTTLLSRIIRLRLSYEGATNAPSTLILKTGLPGRASDMLHSGHREVEFYTQVAAATSAGVVPRCFEAFCDQDTKDWHLILEDLTDSHVIGTTWPLPPTTEQCESIISALARLHAEWWDDPRLGVSVGTWVDTETANQGIGRLADRYGVFAERLGDRLPAERRDLYRRFIDTAPACSRATTHIAIYPSFMATHMSGTSFCRAMAGATSGFSIGMHGGLVSRQMILRT